MPVEEFSKNPLKGIIQILNLTTFSIVFSYTFLSSQTFINMSHNNVEVEQTNSLWGGRFQEPVDAFVKRFTASVDFDQKLYKYDIQGSIAHASMLQKQQILTENETTLIIDGLKHIEKQIEQGTFQWSIDLEDVHMNIETALIEYIGDVGKKLHTGRSRNDQVALDIRLWLRQECKQISSELTRLQQGIVELASKEYNTIMPGFTHLQTAQPVTLGHHLLAWNEAIQRDYERLQDCLKRLDYCPLGSAALAGTSYPIDRHYSAELLGFNQPTRNSLDTVSDRDFAIEFCSIASISMVHLSRISEELILWASSQFDFIHLPDRFCTGSSIMPQKKNPDVPELVRGKSGRVIGHLTNLLVLMKSQPLAYNKDNQEDKEPLFDTVTTWYDSLRAFADMIPALVANKDAMYKAAQQGYSTATDLADYLVKKGVSFRDSHEIVGKSVAYAIQQQLRLDELSLQQLQQFSALIEQDLYQVLTVEGSVNARNHFGGTAPEQVLAAANRAKELLNIRN